MRLASFIVVALAVPFAAACHSSSRVDYGGDSTLLASKPDGPDGKREFRLYPGQDGQPTLNITTTTKREKAFLGVTTADVDLERSKKLGVDAWRGVEITSVSLDSAAARAGFVKGDVITAVNGVAVTSGGMFSELVRTKLPPRERAMVTVLRRPNEDAMPITTTLGVEPDVRVESETADQRIPLTPIDGAREYTGMQIVSLPAEFAKEAFGSAEPVAVIAGVVSGSPAYLEGLRSGDRITSVDGKSVTTLDDVREAIAARARALGLPARDLGEAGATAPTEAPLTIAVDGVLGSHTADVPVIPDLDETTNFHFPILFDWESNPSRTEWEFLDFIFQFGATYESRYLPSPTRSARESSEFSMLPFGMFEVEHTPTQSRYRAFWFIRWGTRG